jgi:dimethylglycine dehydrogenase
MAGAHEQGRYPGGTRRLRDRQLRPPDRPPVRPRTCRRFRSSIQYIVYAESPELKAYRQAGGRELAVLRESDKSYYLREERMGWILGPYEAGAPACFADGVPEWFGKSLLEGDLDRLLPHIEAAQRRVPALANCGIRDVVNGRFPTRPTAARWWGPPGACAICGSTKATASASPPAGGAGWQLAEWIIEGEPGIDMLAVDPRRFGPYTSKRYVVQKNEETYRHVFVIHFPDEERPDARPLKTSPVYDKLKRMGAVFGQRYGWERANWFAPPGVEPKDQWSFRRSNYFAHVGNECRRLRSSVGVIDLTPFTKHEVSGPGAEAWLDGLVANKVPGTVGRIALCHALTRRGGIRSEFTITKLGPEQFYLVSAGAAERYDNDYLSRVLPQDGSVNLRNVTTSRGCFVLAGATLARCAGATHRLTARQRRLPLAHRTNGRGRACDGRAPAACELRRRARLGAALPDRVRAPSVRRAVCRGQGLRHRHGRHARHGIPAYGEVLPHVGQRYHPG